MTTNRARQAWAFSLALAALVLSHSGCSNQNRLPPDSTGASEQEAPGNARNPLWRLGAPQQGFSHVHRNGRLVFEQSDLDDEFHVPIDVVKRAFGFDDWVKPGAGLIPGFRFDVADHPELAGFSVRFEKHRVYFAGGVEAHGIEREIRLNRGGPRPATVTVTLIVALSVEAAQEQMVPVVRQSHADTISSIAARTNQLTLGDVNRHYPVVEDYPVDDVWMESVSFTRHNVYFRIDGHRRDQGWIEGLDLLPFARKIDAAIQAIAPVSMDELETLRPRVTRFELERDTLHGAGATDRRAVSWDVDTPRGGNLTVIADGTGGLDYDDRSNPAVIRIGSEGRQTARLIVIDEWLLFDWQDTPVGVR